MSLFMKYIKLIILATLSIIMVSCGDLFMKEQSDKGITLNQFASCELDMDAFANILSKNIEGDLNCLREKINMFIQAVETDRPGYASKPVLKNFLLKGPIDVEPDVVEIVDSVFDISHIIIGSEKDYIKHSDLDRLIDFLIFFNVHIRETYDYFSKTDPINYKRLIRERGIVYDEFSLIANKLKDLYKENRSGVDRIDSQQFIYNFFKKEPDTYESIKSLMFLKRVFLGGEKWDLTHLEFSTVLEILPELAQIAFDISKGKYYEFDQPQKTLEVFKNDIDILRGVTYFNPESDESVFTIYDVVTAIDTLDSEMLPIDLTKFPKELKKIKEVFLGENDEVIFAKELYNLYGLAGNIMSEGILGYRIYDKYKDLINSTDRISYDFSGFDVYTDTDKMYRDEFARIIQNYKFMKGSNKLPYYSFGTYRNENAVFEIQIIQFTVKKIMEYYGFRNSDARGGYHMVLNSDNPEPGKLDRSVYGLIKDFKWVLRDPEVGLVNIGREGGGELQGVANNMVLLSTLFQYQSNGCDDDVCLEVPEISEFIISIFSALGIKDFFNDEMVKVCANDLDGFGRINPACFRNNFIKVLRTKNIEDENRSIADYMPQLDKYFDELTADVVAQGKPLTDSPDYMKFMQETESFTRVCTHYDEAQTEEVWLKENDAFTVFAGLLNVESTMNRWDLDENGQMDFRNAEGDNEVLNAYYTTYEGAIKGLVAPGGGFLEKLARPVFQFLIKYGRVPNTKKVGDLWKVAKILVSKKAQRADAKEFQPGMILEIK